MSEVIDLLINNQWILSVAIALLGGGLAVWVQLRAKQSQASRQTKQDASAGSRLTVAMILLAVIVAGATYWILFDKPVISPTAALDAPEVGQARPQNTRLLVLVHGWNGDTRDTWQAFPSLIRSDASFTSFDLWAINYPTFQVRRNLGIDQMARWLNETMVRKGYYDKYQEIYVIAHSMGGLIAREMLLVNRLSRDNQAYKSLIEIATPHQGANPGTLLSVLGLSRGFSDDLTPGSPMLRALHEKWNSLKDRPPTYCLSSPHDLVVTQDSAVFQCDEFLYYPEWGHIEMVKPSLLKDDRYDVPMSRVRLIRDRLKQ